ncbi:hypothetical protein V3331_01910 [Gaopeijia maritima]
MYQMLMQAMPERGDGDVQELMGRLDRISELAEALFSARDHGADE